MRNWMWTDPSSCLLFFCCWGLVRCLQSLGGNYISSRKFFVADLSKKNSGKTAVQSAAAGKANSQANSQANGQIAAQVKDQITNQIHILTGSEFCERVAEILGIEKPVFASDLKDKLVKKLELHDRMERPLPEGEDKELAIEVSQLREEDIEALVEMCGEAWAEVPKQALKNKNERYLFYREGGLDCHHKMGLKNLGVTITESVPEFMRYVAKKTGKKWEDKLFNDAFFNNDSSNIMSPDEVDAIIQSIASPPTYPHRLYRVLDSLDGIPFDTRIPLSEWVPPFLKIVLLITEDDQVIGQLTKIIENEIWFNSASSSWSISP